MAGIIMVDRGGLDRLREAFKRYGREVLGDSEITVDFFPTEYEGSVGVLLASANFGSMAFSERQNSVWNFLLSDQLLNKKDMFVISRISTEIESAELV